MRGCDTVECPAGDNARSAGRREAVGCRIPGGHTGRPHRPARPGNNEGDGRCGRLRAMTGTSVAVPPHRNSIRSLPSVCQSLAIVADAPASNSRPVCLSVMSATGPTEFDASRVADNDLRDSSARSDRDDELLQSRKKACSWQRASACCANGDDPANRINRKRTSDWPGLNGSDNEFSLVEPSRERTFGVAPIVRPPDPATAMPGTRRTPSVRPAVTTARQVPREGDAAS